MFFTELKQRIKSLERQNADLRYRMDEPWVQDAKEQYQKKTEDLYQEARKVILMGGRLCITVTRVHLQTIQLLNARTEKIPCL